MGLFDRLTKTREFKAKEKAAAEEQEKKSSKAAVSDSGVTVSDSTKKPAVKKAPKKETAASDVIRVDRGISSRILITPWVSEKAARHADTGTYAFRVATSANKVEIHKAVETLWKVDVDSVRTIRGKGKVFQSRTRNGKRVNWKKALVTLKEGQSIDLYEGV